MPPSLLFYYRRLKNKAFTEVTFLLGLEGRVRFPGSLGSEVEGGLGLAGVRPGLWQRPVRAGEETRAGRGQRGGRQRHGKLACGDMAKDPESEIWGLDCIPWTSYQQGLRGEEGVPAGEGPRGPS